MKTTCLILTTSLLLLTATAFAGDVANSTARHSCCAAMADASPTVSLTDKSIYQLDSSWTNDSNATVKLASLKGRPQVVAMFFANCTYACPLLVYQLQQLETALPPSLRTNVDFLLVSFDTERDTPAALHAYRAQHELGKNWTLLHGNSSDVLDLAALLNVKFKKDAQGQFMHSNVITVLNADGEIVYQQSGLGQDNAATIRAIEQLKL